MKNTDKDLKLRVCFTLLIITIFLIYQFNLYTKPSKISYSEIEGCHRKIN